MTQEDGSLLTYPILLGGIGISMVVSTGLEYISNWGISMLYLFTVILIAFSLRWERIWLEAQGFFNHHNSGG